MSAATQMTRCGSRNVWRGTLTHATVMSMKPAWRSFFDFLFAAPAGARARVARDIAGFGIGFCPGCKRLRGAASRRCETCGSTRPVEPDA